MAENETIAQVETDKVTIDIKAPSEGTILGIVVQEQDTVVPGQLVATLDDAAAKVCAQNEHAIAFEYCMGPSCAFWACNSSRVPQLHIVCSISRAPQQTSAFIC